MIELGDLKEYVNSSKFKDSLKILRKDYIDLFPLANGEYNCNYFFIHPSNKKKIVFRINTKSQLDIDNQIEYEYNALVLLQQSGITPMPYYVDNSKKVLKFGVMAMEYLEGKPLNYSYDIETAVDCLVGIHNTKIPTNNLLIKSQNPYMEILKECVTMYKKAKEYNLLDLNIKYKIEKNINKVLEIIDEKYVYNGYKCCINTELNSGNFLINEKGKKSYIIDWEKPLYGDFAQDLGHFLAPTTTYWKTDTVLNKKDISGIIDSYEKKSYGLFETENLHDRVSLFLKCNSLRGITWCSMAYCEYFCDMAKIKNEDTFKKIKKYLTDDFTSYLEKNIFV